MGKFISGLPTQRRIIYRSKSRTISGEMLAEAKKTDDSLCKLSLVARGKLPFGKTYSYELSSTWLEIDGIDQLLNYKQVNQKGEVEEITFNRGLKIYQKIKDSSIVPYDVQGLESAIDPLALMFSLQNQGNLERFVNRTVHLISFRSIGELSLKFGEEKSFKLHSSDLMTTAKKLTLAIDNKELKDFNLWVDRDSGVVVEIGYKLPVIGSIKMNMETLS